MKDCGRILFEGRAGEEQEFSVGHVIFKMFCQGCTKRHQRLVDLCVDEVEGT